MPGVDVELADHLELRRRLDALGDGQRSPAPCESHERGQDGQLLVLALAIADARRTVGAEAVTPDEASTIRDVADWLERPGPESGQD